VAEAATAADAIVVMTVALVMTVHATTVALVMTVHATIVLAKIVLLAVTHLVATVISVTVDLAVTHLVATVISVTVALAATHHVDRAQTHVEDAQAGLAESDQAAHAQRVATNTDLSGLVSSTRPLTFCPH
jgi:mannitol-specific phosphotransferase system IIBC component